jgi:ketosteroid isomerase-like protein
MAGELEAVALEMFAALDANDADGVIRTGADDMQGIDEISRRWMRGIKEVSDYVHRLTEMVDDVRSRIIDVHETILGEAGIVTCWLEQDYTMEGAKQHVSAPTTICFRREDGIWKIALFHSLPLPQEV